MSHSSKKHHIFFTRQRILIFFFNLLGCAEFNLEQNQSSKLEDSKHKLENETSPTLTFAVTLARQWPTVLQNLEQYTKETFLSLNKSKESTFDTILLNLVRSFTVFVSNFTTSVASDSTFIVVRLQSSWCQYFKLPIPHWSPKL